MTDEQWARWWRLSGPWVTGEPERARAVPHRELNAALPQGATRLEVFAGAGHFTWKDDPGRYWALLLESVAGVG